MKSPGRPAACLFLPPLTKIGLKHCSVILQFLGVFDMARLICNSLRAFILPRLIKFQEKENPIMVFFKFDDLNLELAETIKILKATAQCFGKSETAVF